MGVEQTLTRNRPAVSFFVLLCIGSTLVGCGKSSGSQRLPVYGSVSMAGGEKVNGSITFLPVEGRSGPAATVSIVSGKYQYDRENGPTPGATHVMVNRTLPKGAQSLEMARERLTKDNELAEKAAKAKSPKEKAAVEKAIAEQAASAKQFRTTWTFDVDVAADKSYAHDFTLEP